MYFKYSRSDVLTLSILRQTFFREYIFSGYTTLNFIEENPLDWQPGLPDFEIDKKSRFPWKITRKYCATNLIFVPYIITNVSHFNLKLFVATFHNYIICDFKLYAKNEEYFFFFQIFYLAYLRRNFHYRYFSLLNMFMEMKKQRK